MLGNLAATSLRFTMTPHVTLYNIKTGEAVRVYRATVRDFLATGEWQIEKPAHAVASPDLHKHQLPTAGREANRPASEEVKASVAIEEVRAEEESAKEEKEPAAAPKRAPRRRVAQSEESAE